MVALMRRLVAVSAVVVACDRLFRRRLRRTWLSYRWALGVEGRIGPVGWTFAPSNMNVLRPGWAFEPGFMFVSVEYGNGNSDPVWSLCWSPADRASR